MRYGNGKVWQIAIFALLPLFCLPQTTEAGPNGNSAIRLFQTVSFCGSFKALPKWKRVLSKAPQEIEQLRMCTQDCPPGTESWRSILSKAQGKAPKTQLRMVNEFFNKWPYHLDMDVYGKPDWWATPQEFLQYSGDCEDYAITKYFALKTLGIPIENLRIVILQDKITNQGHAVLVVFLDGDAYVLDNLSNAVFSHKKYPHYRPLYSLNEEYRWSHLPLTNKY